MSKFFIDYSSEYEKKKNLNSPGNMFLGIFEIVVAFCMFIQIVFWITDKNPPKYFIFIYIAIIILLVIDGEAHVNIDSPTRKL